MARARSAPRWRAAWRLWGTRCRWPIPAARNPSQRSQRRPALVRVTVEQAAHAGDVVVVTIPMKNIPRLPSGLFDGVPGEVVVVDTGNYYPQQRDGRIAPIERGTTESRWVSDQLSRPVIKAFNNIYARHLLEHGKPKGAPGRVALVVAGDDKRAKEVVIRLLDELGFDGVDAGSMDESWRQQPGTPVYGTTSTSGASGRRWRRRNRSAAPSSGPRKEVPPGGHK